MANMNEEGDKTFYGIEYIYFSFLGFWQLLNGGLQKRNKVVLASLSFSIVYGCFTILCLYDISAHDYGFARFTEKLSVYMKIVESCVKISICFINRADLSVLIGLFNNDLLLSAKRCKKDAELILTSNAKFVNKGTRSFIYLIFATVVMWAGAPPMKCLIMSECGTMLIFPTWYPFDVSHFPANVLTYLLEICLMIYGASLIYNVNCMFSALALTVSAQFDVLSQGLIKIEENAIDILKNSKIAVAEPSKLLDKQVIMDMLLRECLIDHQNLLRFLQKMEDAYNKIFLFQMVMSTQTICLVLVQLNYHLSSGEDLSPTLGAKFIMYLVLSWSELFLYSWGGQIIQSKSEMIYWSLQKCGWHEGSLSFRKNVCIALIRSYHPFTLSAGKFGSVNLTTFTQVIRASYSYFTFLHGSVKKN